MTVPDDKPKDVTAVSIGAMHEDANLVVMHTEEGEHSFILDDEQIEGLRDGTAELLYQIEEGLLP